MNQDTRDSLIAKRIEEMYLTKANFLRAFKMNPNEVIRYIARSLKTIPYDIKQIVNTMYNELLSAEKGGK